MFCEIYDVPLQTIVQLSILLGGRTKKNNVFYQLINFRECKLEMRKIDFLAGKTVIKTFIAVIFSRHVLTTQDMRLKIEQYCSRICTAFQLFVHIFASKNI